MLIDEAVTMRRGRAVSRLGVLSRAGDPGLTALCRLAAYVTGAAGAAVHILDDVSQYRIAGIGLPLGPEPRENSMCRLVVDGERRIVCADATRDARFGYSSFVHGPDPIRFFASVPLRTSEGVVVGALCAFDTLPREMTDEQTGLLEDLAEQASTQIELTWVATELGELVGQDPLTGAVNRIVLSDRLAQAFARQLRGDMQTLLAVVDIDDFKCVNDEYGHAAGDEVLIEVARRLCSTVRPQDTVARVGGDEFVVLADTDESDEGARRLVARLEAVLDEPIVFAGERHSVVASIGCVFAEPGEEIRTALARADAAMYQRKTAAPGQLWRNGRSADSRRISSFEHHLGGFGHRVVGLDHAGRDQLGHARMLTDGLEVSSTARSPPA